MSIFKRKEHLPRIVLGVKRDGHELYYIETWQRTVLIYHYSRATNYMYTLDDAVKKLKEITDNEIVMSGILKFKK